MNAKKRMIIIAIVLLILLFPIRISKFKDGGSVSYQTLVFQLTRIHQLGKIESDDPYIDGCEFKIFGIEVYRKTNG